MLNQESELELQKTLLLLLMAYNVSHIVGQGCVGLAGLPSHGSNSGLVQWIENDIGPDTTCLLLYNYTTGDQIAIPSENIGLNPCLHCRDNSGDICIPSSENCFHSTCN